MASLVRKSVSMLIAPLPEDSSIDQLWQQFEIWKAAAEHHDCLERITSIGRHRRNPLLNELLPSAAFVRVIAILDLALRRLIDERAGSGDSPPKRDNLAARIDWAVGQHSSVERITASRWT